MAQIVAGWEVRLVNEGNKARSVLGHVGHRAQSSTGAVATSIKACTDHGDRALAVFRAGLQNIIDIQRARRNEGLTPTPSGEGNHRN
jgi:hypothetical protein